MSAGSLWNVATRAYIVASWSPDVPRLIVALPDTDRRGLPVMFATPKPREHLPGLRASAPPDGLGGWRASGEGGRPPWGMAAALTLPERRSARRLRGLEPSAAQPRRSE